MLVIEHWYEKNRLIYIYMVMCFLQIIMFQRPVWFVENVSSLQMLWVFTWTTTPSTQGGACFPQLVSLLLQGMETLLLLCWLIWISLLLRNRYWQCLLWDLSTLFLMLIMGSIYSIYSISTVWIKNHPIVCRLASPKDCIP